MTAFGDLPRVEQALVYMVITSGLLGLLINSLLTCIILKHKEIRQAEYMIFILNRCLIDAVFTLNLLFLEPVGIVYWTTQPIYCAIGGGILNSIALTIVLTEAGLAANRYFSICHKEDYQKVFGKRNNYYICLAMWILGFIFTIPHISSGALAKVPGYYCGVKLDISNVISVCVSDYLLFLVSYGTLAICYCKIFLFLKKHQTHVNLGQNSRLQEDKGILYFIGASAILPLITESPMVVGSSIRIYDPDLVPDYIMCGVSFVYLLFPVINPALTIVMVKPIRLEALGLMGGFWKKKPITTNVIQVNVYSLNNNNLC